MNRRKEFHISGAPGSGKSHLGETLRSFGLFVVDMDNFFQPGDGIFERLQALRESGNYKEMRELWHRVKLKRFVFWRALAGSRSVIVWVGLTDHMAPPNEPFYEMPPSTVLFYIDISDKDLCRQYYSRLIKNEEGDTDWLNVPSSKEIVMFSQKMKEEHLKHGYILLPPDEIKRRIIVEQYL